ncbi:MAG: SRPBCC family protein [Bacteroidetes bacterium]|nr:SRPBCC family protein [Bacteroidota bacterium]
MPVIEIETKIKAGIEICFDLATSIDLHLVSTEGTNEKAIDGVTSGCVKQNDFVTWEATHFGVRQQLTSIISLVNRPFHFRDEQKKGVFKYFKHDHYFETHGEFVTMKDRFEYESPYGVFGKLFNSVVLTKHLTKFLLKRNAVIKDYAESGKWKEIIK